MSALPLVAVVRDRSPRTPRYLAYLLGDRSRCAEGATPKAAARELGRRYPEAGFVAWRRETQEERRAM